MSTETHPPSTRERILRAAWAAIESRGAETRLSDIADEAGVSRQAVYLHFRDRPGLLLALVEFMDGELGVGAMAAHVFAAESGTEMLERAVALNATLSPSIDGVARVLEAAQSTDEAMAAAWRSRMDKRRAGHRAIVQRIADEGRLAPGWTAEEAADLVSVTLLPSAWRELTQHLGWSAEQYRERTAQFLRGAFVR
ncbi:TetR/AcrR family transcriptional regulator [Lysobacter korlensis]|uniref:TetR/AcrR family transcriptional regulator n=1 Tax=Lysobacter korlensis TaxID=553636 RepID=A0ABV6RW21_9GAMM